MDNNEQEPSYSAHDMTSAPSDSALAQAFRELAQTQDASRYRRADIFAARIQNRAREIDASRGDSDDWFAEQLASMGTVIPLKTQPAAAGELPEPVGVVGTMPGTAGFTMAAFKAEDVPVGTKLYASPAVAEEPAAEVVGVNGRSGVEIRWLVGPVKIGDKLYTAPPAQAVDLEQFRRVAKYAKYWADEKGNDEVGAAADRLLALLAAQQPAAPVLAKHQPCGCVICTCEDEQQCQGCGAKHCGNRADHPPYVGQQPAAPSGEAVAWLRMKPDGTPDWAEDCIGSDDKFLDPEMASDGYYLQPLYTAPQQPEPQDTKA